jgi:photosystem II stability/assembly factor-like uncharacterized protein
LLGAKMKKHSLLIIFLFYFNNISYGQWNLRVNGLPEWGIADPLSVAKDSTVVVIVRTSYLPKPISVSSDLANSWINYNTPEIWGGTDVTVFDRNNIWFCTGYGKIYHSNDGGINWIKQFEDTISLTFFNFIKFFDKNNGIVIGDAITAQSPAVVLKTTDGGNNWISVNLGSLIGEISYDLFYPIDFPSISIGYFFGDRNNKLYKTIDGGASWQPLTLPAGVNKINTIKFYDENMGMFVSYNYPGDNFFYRTSDGGNSWTKLSRVTNRNLHDIEFLPGSFSNVWFTNYDNLYFSSDTGNTWQEVPIVDSSLAAHNIEFLNDSIGFVLCCDGNFFATENNGGIITSINDKNISVVNEYSLFQNYPNPFNPSTKINWQSPVGSWHTLKIYDVLGKEITTLIDEYKPSGRYEIEFNASMLPSGVYVYKLQAGDFISFRKMMLLK